MEIREEARFSRLEDRVERLESKERERREFVFRLITNSFVVVMIILTTVIITLAATHPSH